MSTRVATPQEQTLQSVTIVAYPPANAIWANVSVLHPTQDALPPGWIATQRLGTQISTNDHLRQEFDELILSYTDPDGVTLTFYVEQVEGLCHIRTWDEEPRPRPTTWEIHFVSPGGEHFLRVSCWGNSEEHNRFMVMIVDR